ncbi:MAG: M14 family zinc carboxypeptidase, partial [Bacteroidota bacterium]
MNRTLRWALLLLTTGIMAQQTVTLDYYLPEGVSYDPNIPKPIDIIGHEIGEWHVSHDHMVFYLRVLASASNRITLQNRGATFEDRPLQTLTITSPENHANLEEIRKSHLALSDRGSAAVNIASMPIVVYQGFTIHGNEPSGTNAALAYAYYLAAAQGEEIEAILDNTVILLDACMNPDGFQRFAQWANTHRNHNLNPDKNDREYHEIWPGGRTNHYWFDMNRDWLPVQLPESRSRIATYHRWLPNIVTDHHEMGTNSTYFFQPGVPSRVNPLTPKKNQELTAEIGTYHAKALDAIGSLYYSEENFDDYYYGKGSTYPDVNGGIGILFEQGSSRGHVQESENGLVTFPFTIKNQFTTSLSTITAASAMRTKILNYQRKYFQDMAREASRSRTKGYVFGDAKDAAKAWHLAEILDRHNIRVHELKSDVTLGGKAYRKGFA